MPRPAVAALVLVAVVAAACGSSAGAHTIPTVKASASSKGGCINTKPSDPHVPPLPAGPSPSAISKEVCAKTAQVDIAHVLGVTAKVAPPTWKNHQYSCKYGYSNGYFVMSVQELSSWALTCAYYASQQSQLGDTSPVGNLGQGAFTTTDGSIVVRKDWKVLYVNIAGLPAQFGKPPTSRGDVAYTIADIILGCWAGD